MLSHSVAPWRALPPRPRSRPAALASSFGSGAAAAAGHPAHFVGQLLLGPARRAEAIVVGAAAPAGPFSVGLGGLLSALRAAALPSAPGLSALVLSPSAALPAGGRLRATARLLSALAGPALFGAVTSPLSAQVLRLTPSASPPRPGAPRSRPAPAPRWLIESPAPPLLSRRAVSEPLRTGVVALDSLAPAGRGQRELVLGDRQTGKTSICLDAALGQESEGVGCVFASVALRAPALLGTSFSVPARAAAAAFVAASSRARAPLQYLAPYAAAAAAEYLMWAGQVPALLALDDLTKHAAAYREVSLLLRRPPGREAYPGEIFFVHSRLLERSAKLSLASGGGSVTCFPVVEALAGDVSGYVATNAISITDGQAALSPELFLSGARPAVDAGLSVSRAGSAAQWAGLRGAAASYKIEVARCADLQSFAQLSADLGPSTQRALRRGALLGALLKQPCGAPAGLARELLVLSLSCGPSPERASGAGGAPAARAVPRWLLLSAGPRPVAAAP